MSMVGFIGLGRMGRPMAANMQRKGFHLIVHDLNQEAVQELALLQARPAKTVAEVSQASDVIFTMLPNSAVVHEIVSGVEGILAHAKPGTIVVDMSTVSPETTDALAHMAADKGCSFVDAPVGRLAQHADKGESLFMVGPRIKITRASNPCSKPWEQHSITADPLVAVHAPNWSIIISRSPPAS